MYIKKYKPVTPSLRHTALLVQDTISVRKPLKLKLKKFKKTAGRNNRGRITCFTKGGGHKRRLRIIEYDQDFVKGIVESIEYDPNRSANIARVFDAESLEHFYILAPRMLERGDSIDTFILKQKLSFYLGSTYFLNQLPLGSNVYNVRFPYTGTSACARSAGCSALLISKTLTHCRLRLPSGEQRMYPLNTSVCLGQISNSLKKLVKYGKAGRVRWLGKRPSVRGVAMNPIDHPHGGGEGKTSGGRIPVTPWGKITKGKKTRKNKKSNYILKTK